MKAIRIPFCTHRFTLTGLNLERFMNAMQKEGVVLLSARRTDSRALRCECYSADLPQIQRLAAEKGWRLDGASPAGLSALLCALRARPGIPVGLVMMLALVAVLTRFVWRVEINGAGPYRAEIAVCLMEEGVGPGTPRSAVNAAALERSLTRRYPKIAWFHVYVVNVTLVVDVSPGVPMPDAPASGPGDVVATRGGLVTEVRVFAGTAQVKPGEAVRAGQVLISGEERGADGALVPVRARGVVVARCWRSHTVTMPLREAKSEETGREASCVQLCTPWLSLPALPEGPEYLAYNTYIRIYPVVGCFFPLSQKETVWREVSQQYARRRESEVRREASEAAFRALRDALYGYEIIDKWADYCMIDDGTLAATVTVEWRMDIGGEPS